MNNNFYNSLIISIISTLVMTVFKGITEDKKDIIDFIRNELNSNRDKILKTTLINTLVTYVCLKYIFKSNNSEGCISGLLNFFE